MLVAFMDESRDNGRDGVFAVGGFVGESWNCFDAERAWADLLQKYRLESVKASKNRRLAREFLRIATSNALTGFGVAIPQAEFYKAMEENPSLKPFGQSPYWLAYHQAMIQIAHYFQKAGVNRVISFVADEHAKFGHTASPAYEGLCAKNPITAASMGSFDMRDDRNCVLLQAADLLASEIRLQAKYFGASEQEERPLLKDLRAA
jgi:hypothetical protein